MVFLRGSTRARRLGNNTRLTYAVSMGGRLVAHSPIAVCRGTLVFVARLLWNLRLQGLRIRTINPPPLTNLSPVHLPTKICTAAGPELR